MKKTSGYIILGGAVLFILIQFIPYGHNHTNPPVLKEPNWGSPEARQIAQRACFDCHSNETVYPWYSNVAPISWLLQNHIDEGRSVLNFSNWDGVIHTEDGDEDLDTIAEVLRDGEMPMSQYLLMHPTANLTDAEKETLIQGLGTTASQ